MKKQCNVPHIEHGCTERTEMMELEITACEGRKSGSKSESKTRTGL